MSAPAKPPSENLSNGIVSTEKEEEGETEDPTASMNPEQRPDQLATRSQAAETPPVTTVARIPDSGLSRNRHFESSDEDEYPGNNKATEWEIIVPA
jgi:hypothetical protein